MFLDKSANYGLILFCRFSERSIENGLATCRCIVSDAISLVTEYWSNQAKKNSY